MNRIDHREPIEMGAIAREATAPMFGAFAGFVALASLLGIAAYPSLAWMVTHDWFGGEDYSHGALIPVIAEGCG